MNRTVKASEVAFTALNGASVLVCLLATLLVCGLRLHKKTVYRLALYQVLSSVFFATVETFQIAFLHYDTDPDTYGRLCDAVGSLLMYIRWVKVFFTSWITFHLFCFTVFHKNLKRLELLYVITSLVLPLAMAIVPLATNTYGVSPSYNYCYIYSNITSSVTLIVERFVLWDVPAMVVLFALSAATFVILISVVRLLRYRKLRFQPIPEDKDQFWKAFKELVPLISFPILFLICIIPNLVFHVYIYVTEGTKAPEGLIAYNLVSISLWSMTSGITLIVHLSLTRFNGKRTKPLKAESQAQILYGTNSCTANISQEIKTIERSTTWFEAIDSTEYSYIKVISV